MKIISEIDIENAVSLLAYDANILLAPDTLRAFSAAAKREAAPSKNIFDIYQKNARIARAQNLPVCQDSGVAVIFVELGRGVQIKGDIYKAINKGVAKGYKNNYLRKSVVADPLFDRKNTGTNTPAVIHIDIVKGDKLKITMLPKGAGAENMSALKMLPPSAGIDGVKDFIIQTVKNADANPCPPIVVGVGVGGDFELSAILAKKALMRPIGKKNKDSRYAALEQELLTSINKLGIGPQGFGGKTTAFSVSIEYAPCHTASLPVAVNIGCHVHRHASVTL